MFNLIPISLLITAIGGIVYIVSNHLSEFNTNEENDSGFKFNIRARFAEWTGQLPLDNIKSQSLSITQKLLHRFRLALLKTDNYLMKLIGKISEHNNELLNGNGSSDFWEDLAKKKDEKQITMPTADCVTPKANFVQPTAEPEVKIDFAVKSDAAEKFFDIKPGSESSTALKGQNKKIVELLLPGKPVKKSLKTKKSSK